MDRLNDSCPQCGSTQYQHREIHGACGCESRIFDIQGQTFPTGICAHPYCAELQHADQSRLGNIVDVSRWPARQVVVARLQAAVLPSETMTCKRPYSLASEYHVQ